MSGNNESDLSDIESEGMDKNVGSVDDISEGNISEEILFDSDTDIENTPHSPISMETHNVIECLKKYVSKDTSALEGTLVEQDVVLERIRPFLPVDDNQVRQSTDLLSEVEFREIPIRTGRANYPASVRKTRRNLRDDEWTVEAIIANAMVTNDKGVEEEMFLVQWSGWDEEDNTWEPLKNVRHLKELFFWFFPNAKTSAGCSGTWCSMLRPNDRKCKSIDGRYTQLLHHYLEVAFEMDLYDGRVGFYSTEFAKTQLIELEFFDFIRTEWLKLSPNVYIGEKVIGHSSRNARGMNKELNHFYLNTTDKIRIFLTQIIKHYVLSLFLIILPFDASRGGLRPHTKVLIVRNDEKKGLFEYFVFDSMNSEDGSNSIPRELETALATIGQTPRNTKKTVRIAYGSKGCDNDCIERCLILMANILDGLNFETELDWIVEQDCCKRN